MTKEFSNAQLSEEIKEQLGLGMFQSSETDMFVALEPNEILKYKIEKNNTPKNIHFFSVIISSGFNKTIKKSCCGQIVFHKDINIDGYETKTTNDIFDYAKIKGDEICGECMAHLVKDNKKK